MNIDDYSEEYLEGYCRALGTIVWPYEDGKWVQEVVCCMALGYRGIVYFIQEIDE